MVTGTVPQGDCALFSFSSFALSNVLAQNSFITCVFCLPSSRMIDVQTQMTGRALELLGLPEGQPCYLLDIG